jgi:hypothetical protein
MDADLDTLCTVVYCTADDLLPEPPGNARRMVREAEVVTLCVAQAIMGIPSDRRFLKSQPAYFKRRRRLADQLEWLMGMFAIQSPGYSDDLLLIDSTPVECARSRETSGEFGSEFGPKRPSCSLGTPVGPWTPSRRFPRWPTGATHRFGISSTSPTVAQGCVTSMLALSRPTPSPREMPATGSGDSTTHRARLDCRMPGLSQ